MTTNADGTSASLESPPVDPPGPAPAQPPGSPEPELDAASAAQLLDGLTVRAGSYEGPLEGLVLAVQRGDVDAINLPVHDLTRAYRDRLREREDRPDPRQVADFLQLASRLVALKAGRVLPDGQDDEGGADADVAVDDPGARLAEYRLFKDAAEALLSEAAEEGARSFLGLVVPDVLPVERLTISPERLAAAFRAVLERITEVELPVGERAFSVEEKVQLLLALLRDEGPSLAFERVFLGAGSRMEAVACFLALLELLRRGLARVTETAGVVVVQRLD